MPVEIRETIVTPDSSGYVVQLQISDVPLPAEDAAIRLTLAVSIPAYEAPALEHLQRETLTVAQSALTDLLRSLAVKLQQGGHDLHPRLRDD